MPLHTHQEKSKRRGRCGETGALADAADGNGNGATILGDNSTAPQEVKDQEPHDPAVPLPDRNPRETESHVHTKTFTQRFRAVLFIIAKR